MFVAGPPDVSRPELALVRAVGRAFTGTAEFLSDPENRARTAGYLTDMASAYGRDVPADRFAAQPPVELGQSYGEMAQVLIESVAPADEPVDLLVLAYSVHDLRPGRQTATYLSDVTPGAPLAFAVCDQGSAAAFSGLRIIRDYAASTGIRRALLIVVEQAALPYDCPIPLPWKHQGVAMLFDASPTTSLARVCGVWQHPGVPTGDVAGLAAADLAELAVGHGEIGVVLGNALAAAWTEPVAGRVRVAGPGQPGTGVWSTLVDELSGDGTPSLLVAADYDPELRYLCLTGFAVP